VQLAFHADQNRICDIAVVCKIHGMKTKNEIIACGTLINNTFYQTDRLNFNTSHTTTRD